VTIGARVTKTQYQYTLHDANVQELQQWAPRLMRALATPPQLQDVTTDDWIKRRLGGAVHLTDGAV
jgi:multidrug efflux pump